MRIGVIVFIYCTVSFFSVKATPVQKITDAKKLVTILKGSGAFGEDAAGNRISAGILSINRVWKNNVCHSDMQNTGTKTISISNLTL